MEIISFIAGVIVGYGVEKGLDFLGGIFRRLWMKRQWRKAEQAWKKHQSLSPGLEVIQTGWIDGEFVEDDVAIAVGADFHLEPDIKSQIYDHHRKEWEDCKIKNNLQIGVYDIDPHRVVDGISGDSSSHELLIKGQSYRYYDFLATNSLFQKGMQVEQDLLRSKVEKLHYLEPPEAFANPLSVGLSLFCEGGNCLVLTKRTKKVSSGGLFSGSKIYNGVGENTTPTDVHWSIYDGKTRLSPWMTAKRGLSEEMGIIFNEKTMSLKLLSFVWDNRILDYKFFGYTVNLLSRSRIVEAWKKADDRHENSEVFFYDCANEKQNIQIIEGLLRNKNDWAQECILCTIMSMLHYGKLNGDKIEKYISGTS